MDVARTAMRKGVREIQCFSRDKGVAASQHEFQYAILEGVEFVYQKTPVEILDEGVVFADLVTDASGHTTRPGVFASGDVVLGARTVVEAVAYSKVVAEAMDRYLQNLPKEKTEA